MDSCNNNACKSTEQRGFHKSAKNMDRKNIFMAHKNLVEHVVLGCKVDMIVLRDEQVAYNKPH